ARELLVTSEVDMVAAGDDVIADYVASGEWRGKAGAYAVQGIAAALVSSVRGGDALHGVGAGLAAPLARRDVVGDHVVAGGDHVDLGGHQELARGAGPDETHRGRDPMGPPDEPAQHRHRLGVVGGLAQHDAVELDDRVGGEHEVTGVARARRCLLGGDAAHVRQRRLAVVLALVDVRRADDGIHADARQELAATWRGGGEEQHRAVF
ncbi:MAG: Maf family protein, partial [Deltaproteobacteria bacterium]|nr:Maf family protein [Kofleriaceae bacterium]